MDQTIKAKVEKVLRDGIAPDIPDSTIEKLAGIIVEAAAVVYGSPEKDDK